MSLKKQFRLSTRESHVDRKALWSTLKTSLVRKGFDVNALHDVALRGQFNLVKNENSLIGTHNLLAMGLPVEDLHHIKPEHSVADYEEAFKSGIHPREFNDALERHGLDIDYDGREENTTSYQDYYGIRHGGALDYISARKSGATDEEVGDALNKLRTVNRVLKSKHENPDFRSSLESKSKTGLPPQDRIIEQSPMSPALVRRISTGDLDAQNLEQFGRTVTTYHPLRLYSDFRSVPGSTHEEFKRALGVATKKWQGLLDKNSYDSTVPHFVNLWTNLRTSGASPEQAERVVTNSNPLTSRILEKFAPNIPFHEISEASKSTGNLDGLKKYISDRVYEGKTHQEALGIEPKVKKTTVTGPIPTPTLNTGLLPDSFKPNL